MGRLGEIDLGFVAEKGRVRTKKKKRAKKALSFLKKGTKATIKGAKKLDKRTRGVQERILMFDKLLAGETPRKKRRKIRTKKIGKKFVIIKGQVFKKVS